MRVPSSAAPDVKAAIKDIIDALSKLGASTGQNLDLAGTRMTNAGDAIMDNEYVTLRQLNAHLSTVNHKIRSLQKAANDAAAAIAGDGTGTPGDGGTTGGDDDGGGSQGCASCGPTGHVSGSAPLTTVTAGQVVCGTGQEFPALTAPCADQGSRDTNQEQLLLRMIWHLQQAGFTAGRQRNPSGIISGDKLTVQVEGTYLAYDVFQGVDFNQQMPVHMDQVFPADYVADSGIAD